jgi:glycosyltransferase involved in cell wall biosynthesis
MLIAVNTRFLAQNRLDSYASFVFEIFKRIAQEQQQHQFIFIFDRTFDANFDFTKNITPIVISPKVKDIVSFKYWYDIKLPFGLKKYKPDLLVQPTGFCSLTTSIPQLLILQDLAFKHYSNHIPKNHLAYYNHFSKKFIDKAKHIITLSNFSKQDIISTYNVEANKIDVVHSAANHIFKPLDHKEIEQVKDGYADGRAYFLFVGGFHPRKNLMNVLKAFSLFKKWQRSNMKLLVAGTVTQQYDDILIKLKTYKYRDDVVLLDHIDEARLAKITASAYCVLYPSYFEGLSVPIIEAMQSAVPIITSNNSSMPEIGGDAALYVNPNDAEELAEKMQLIYKDENLRSNLIKRGIEQATIFNWDTATARVWGAIVKTNTIY